MATRKKILFPRSDIPGRAPTLNEIDFGEIAINTHDGKAYLKRNNDGEVSIQSIGAEEVDNVYYVSKSGDYGNNGQSLTNSFKTVDSAVAVVTAKQSFKFNKEVCERDLNLIMDAVRYDMVLNTNYNAVTAGLSYRRGNAAKVTSEQKYQTRRAINEERVGMISAPLVASNATATDRVVAGFTEIIDIFYDGEADDLVFTDPPIEAATDANNAANAIQANKTAIQDAVLTYVNTTELASYDAGKCSRDVGLIIDAVARDLILGSNHNTLTAGNSYLRSASAYVLSDQNFATISAVNYARDLILALPEVTNDSTVTNLFKTITDFIDGTTLAYTIPSNPTRTSLYQTTDRVTAELDLSNARTDIINQLTSWISANYPNLEYNQAACEEDTGYIVDALRHDIKYGGNTATRIAASAYFVGTTSQLGGGEEAATAAAYGELKNIVNQFIQQAPEEARASALIDIVIDVINAGNLDSLTAIEEIVTTDMTGVAEYQAIVGEKNDVQTATVDYVNQNFKPSYPSFNQDKCYRDVGLILDAVGRDLALGTDYNTITGAFAYKRANSAYVLSDQKDLTIAAILFAKREVKRLAAVVSDSTVDTLFKRFTDVLETRVTTYQTPTYPTTPNATYQTSERSEVADILQATKADAIAYITNFISTNFPILTYDQSKCERDVGYVVDALTHDIKYGGNSAMRQNAASYWVGNQVQTGSDEQAATATAMGQLSNFYQSLIDYSGSGTDFDPNDAIFNNKTDIDTLITIVSTVISSGLDSLPDEIDVDMTGAIPNKLEKFAIDGARLLIQDQTIVYANDRFFNPAYDQSKCFRDVGLILDAIKRDLHTGTDYNSLTAANSYLRANSAYVLENQDSATILAVNFARDQVKALADVTQDARVDSLVGCITMVLDGTKTTYQDPVYPTNASLTYQTADKVSAAQSLIDNRASIITDLKTYVQGTIGLTDYDSTRCDRDTGYLVDALTHDVKYGGNTASRNSALAYFVGTENQLGNESEEIEATITAYGQLKTIINSYVTTTPEQTQIGGLIDLTVNVLEADDDAAISPIQEIELAGINIEEFSAIDGAKVEIQNATIDFINDTQTVSSFDDEKCARDTDLIVRAISIDLQNNTNYNSTVAGLSYQRVVADKVQKDQLDYTVQSIEYLGTLLAALSISDTSKTFVAARIDEIIDLIKETSNYGAYDGDPLDFTGTASVTFDLRAAQQALLANRVKIQRRVIQFLDENYDTLEYDQDACVRDLGFIIDALQHDVLFDQQYGTERAAQAYWTGRDLFGPDQNLDGNADVYDNLLGTGEVLATVAAYQQLKTIIADYVTTATEQAKVNTLIDIIISSISANDPNSIPETIPNTLGDADTVAQANLSTAVVAFANQIFPAFSYNQATCRRDVGYILDALSYDMRYGGTTATYTAQRAYFSIFNNGYVDLLGQNELNATIQAYTQLKTILAGYMSSLDAGVTTRLNNLLDIIVKAVQQSRDGTYTLGEFFGADRDLEVYQYNTPTGLATGYESVVFPDLIALGYKVTFNDLYNAFLQFDVGASQRLTIIRSSNAVANNQGTDSTIFVKSGDYIINNPIKLPPKTSIIGDALRSVTFRPKSVDSDFFWADNGVYLKEITFRDHQDGAACLAYDPRVDSPGAGPFITQSPYVQNCTSLTTSGTGLRIDGSKVTGLRSMVLDAFTQFNAGGIGVYLLNRGYSQLVSLFTVSTTTSVLAETGGQCSLTNSNSSFGDRGLVATGGSPSLYSGDLHATYPINTDTIRINTIITNDSADYTKNIGDFKKPNYNDAVKFDSENFYYTVTQVSDEITQDWSITGNSEEVEQYAQNTKLLGAEYGTAVSVSNDDNYLIVSEPKDGAGKAEVFKKDIIGGVPTWIYEALVQPTGTVKTLTGDETFGSVLQLSKEGTVAAISAPTQRVVDNGDSARENGGVYIFNRTGAAWTQSDFVTTGSVADRDRKFGESISMSEDGTVMCVGQREDSIIGGQGKLYIYQRDDIASEFALTQEIVIPEGALATATLPKSTLNIDGADLVVTYDGSVNKLYYYQRNIDGVYILAQTVLPNMNFSGAREPSIIMNETADYMIYADPLAPRGYVNNSFTDPLTNTNQFTKKQALVNCQFATGPTRIISSDSDVNFAAEFPIGSTITVAGSTNNNGTYEVSSATASTLNVTAANWSNPATESNIEVFLANAGCAEFFLFFEGQWVTQDIIESKATTPDQFKFGTSVDLNSRGIIGLIGNGYADSSEVSIVERAASDWERVSTLVPHAPTDLANSNVARNDLFGSGVSAGGSGDLAVIGAPFRREDQNDSSTQYGGLFTYYSILDETGSFEVTLAPGLNNALGKGQNVNFHQRSQITASGHTFEFVGSGTNMFTAIPQNGGIPDKSKEIVFDSVGAADPNFGLVYFTATDELGDFRIGEDLTINREEGRIDGITFDRSLFAVLTPFILALEG